MDTTSAMFGKQADADFWAASSIPRHDLSGHDLGMAIFFSQQRIEKQPVRFAPLDCPGCPHSKTLTETLGAQS